MLFANYPFVQSKIIGSVSWYASLNMNFFPEFVFPALPFPIDVKNNEAGEIMKQQYKKIMSITRGIYSKSFSAVNAPFVIVIFPLLSFI